MRIASGACLALVLLVVLASYGGAARSSARCTTGDARAFIAIQDDPVHLVGTIPSQFTDDRRYFSRRYNCRRMSAEVRRVDLGVYDVKFPGLVPRLVLGTAISQEGVFVSVQPIGEGIVRVALRGPLFGSEVATRRDVPFSLVVY